MAWRPNSLAPLRSAPRVKKFLALDTEDDQLGYGTRTGFYLGCLYDDGAARMFTDRRRLRKALAGSELGGCFVAAHNLEYDLLNVFGPRAVVGMAPTFSGSKMCSAMLRVKPGNERDCFVRFFDTGCFLMEPLKKLAPLVGLEKLDMVHRAGRRHVGRKEREYCARDAEIVWRLAGLIQEGVNALGAELRLTAASTSMDCFRRKYLHEEIPCLPSAMQTLMHQGYYGGRVECFRLGTFSDGPYYKNDVNGAYVSCMISGNLPTIENFGRRSSMNLAREGMAHVRLKVPNYLWAAPLPVKGEKLVFPTGRLDGWWTYNELRQAINAGVQVMDVLDCYSSEKSEPYLRDMMLELRKIRENPATPGPVSKMAKLLGNSLYGKFAQRNENVEYYREEDFALAVQTGRLAAGRDFTDETTEHFPRLGIVRVARPADFPVHANTIWSACITAGCRNLLYNHIVRPLAQDGAEHTYYCDTDSVIATVAYPQTKTIGALALDKTYDRIIVRGNKLYAGHEPATGTWEAHAKGVPRDLALEAVETCGQGRRLESRRPVKFRTAVKGGERANRWLEVSKTLSGDYDKRRVLADGRTEPWEVKQW